MAVHLRRVRLRRRPRTACPRHPRHRVPPGPGERARERTGPRPFRRGGHARHARLGLRRHHRRRRGPRDRDRPPRAARLRLHAPGLSHLGPRRARSGHRHGVRRPAQRSHVPRRRARHLGRRTPPPGRRLALAAWRPRAAADVRRRARARHGHLLRALPRLAGRAARDHHPHRARRRPAAPGAPLRGPLRRRRPGQRLRADPRAARTRVWPPARPHAACGAGATLPFSVTGTRGRALGSLRGGHGVVRDTRRGGRQR